MARFSLHFWSEHYSFFAVREREKERERERGGEERERERERDMDGEVERLFSYAFKQAKEENLASFT